MKVISIPPESALFLNRLTAVKGGEELDLIEEIKHYRVFHQFTLQWLQGKSALTDEEQTRLSNALYLLQRREELLNEIETRGLDDGLYDELRKIEFEIADTFTALTQEREKSPISPIPAVNELLMSTWASIHREAPLERVKEALDVANGYLRNLEGDYNAIAHTFKEEVKHEFALGFEVTKTALADIGSALLSGDRAALEGPSGRLKEGSGLLNYYLEWQQSQEEKLLTQFNRFNIPFIGPDLQILLEEMREGNYSEEKLLLIKEFSLPKLLQFWEATNERLFIKPSQKLELLEKMDEALQALQAAFESLKENTGASIDHYEECLQKLSSLFTAIDHETLHWNSLIGTGGELLGEAIKNVYYGTLPDFALEEVIGYFKYTPQVSYLEEGIAQLEAYFQDHNRERLLHGLEHILAVLPGKEEEADSQVSTIPCAYCGTANEPARAFCSKCNARLMFKEAIILDQDQEKEGVEEKPVNLMELPLPATAEPLIRLVNTIEKGTVNDEDAKSYLYSFRNLVENAKKEIAADKSLPPEGKEKMKALMEVFSEAAAEAIQYLSSHDSAVIHRALRKISEASVNARRLGEPQEAREE
ncbi:MAG: hypothetical protein RDV48_04790 [Candidatus Eremiobacteraeota bacterium]|nr:hypothetical protein [Candidatus Eremiobacteraeota bacterium]